MYKKIKHIHLIGIGGIGMSGIAELLLQLKHTVTGSDLQTNDTIKRLESLGARIFIGHDAHNLEGTELAVFSAAIPKHNPEYLFAEEKLIPIIPRAEMLAELMRLKYGIGVAGAHGKTTTTSMIALVLIEGQFDPTVIVGGRMDNFGGTNARMGSGEFMVVEADESDGSFNCLSPCIAVVTNIDKEHLDHYGTVSHLRKAFLNFLSNVPFYGLGVICGDDPHLRILRRRIHRRCQTYGFGIHNDYRILQYEPGTSRTVCRVQIGSHTETLRLRVPGRHNALNAVAALAVADELSIPRRVSLAALESFQGVRRRFQFRGEKSGVLFIDDYAHHPTEICATLSAARERFPHSKIRVLFQPHRYSRVESLIDEFSDCFRDCDALTLLPIYAAGENPIAGVSSDNLAELISQKKETAVLFARSPLEGVAQLCSESKPGDVILTLGAGDLPNVYKQIFE